MSASSHNQIAIPGNRIEVFENGTVTYTAMLRAIARAQSTILFANFCMQSGEVFDRFLTALDERARAGVDIYILADRYGSGRTHHEQVEQLRQVGVNWVWYQPLTLKNLWRYNHHLHKKLLIIDGQTAFTGGVGLADFWDRAANGYPQRWRDTHFIVKGPVISEMSAAFAKSWHRFSRQPLPPIETPTALKGGVSVAAIDSHDRPAQMTQVGEHLCQLVRSAEHEVTAISAYFGPTRQLRRALKAATNRGVRVRLLLNGPHATHGVARDAGRHWYGQMLRAGLEIYEYQPTKIHCKIMVVDGKISSIGSANLNFRTLRHDDEFNLAVHDRQLATKLVADFEADLHHSHKINIDSWNARPFKQKLRQGLASLARWVF